MSGFGIRIIALRKFKAEPRANGARALASFDLEAFGFRILKWTLVFDQYQQFRVEPPMFDVERDEGGRRIRGTGERIVVFDHDLRRDIARAAAEVLEALPQ